MYKHVIFFSKVPLFFTHIWLRFWSSKRILIWEFFEKFGQFGKMCYIRSLFSLTWHLFCWKLSICTHIPVLCSFFIENPRNVVMQRTFSNENILFIKLKATLNYLNKTKFHEQDLHLICNKLKNRSCVDLFCTWVCSDGRSKSLWKWKVLRCRNFRSFHVAQ